MRIEYRGTVPVWFSVVWLALGAAWVIIRIRSDRRRALRAPSTPVVATGWRASPFSLNVYEQNIFGVRQLGDSVVFEPSGRQVVAGTLVPVVSTVAVAVVASAHPRPWLLVAAIACGSAAFVYALAGFRVRVCVSPVDIAIRRRFGGERCFAWAAVHDVRVEIRATNGQLRGSSTSVAVGVMHAVGQRPFDLPGFRCIAWVDDDGRDDLTVAAAKVEIVRRYRESLIGPWPAS